MPAALAKRIIDELQSGPEGLHQVLARFVERARQAQCAVELLADKGLIGDAMAVFRTVVDIAIDVAYIVEPAADRDSRLSKFQAFECVTDWKFVAEFGVKEYDIAALVPIVTEAGGRFTDIDGADSIASRSSLATNGVLHDELLAILNDPSA